MRMLMRVRLDTEASNKAIKDGRLQRTVESAIDQLKPEAAYFTTLEGDRTAYFFFDMTDPAQMPPIAEPFFMNFQAKVDYFPVMNFDDVQAGLGQLQAARK